MHVLIVVVDIFALIACLVIKQMDALLYVHVIGILMVGIIVVIPHKCFNKLNRT